MALIRGTVATVAILFCFAASAEQNQQLIQQQIEQNCSAGDQAKMTDADRILQAYDADVAAGRRVRDDAYVRRFMDSTNATLTPSCKTLMLALRNPQPAPAAPPAPSTGCTPRQMQAAIARNGMNNYRGPLADCRTFPP